MPSRGALATSLAFLIFAVAFFSAVLAAFFGFPDPLVALGFTGATGCRAASTGSAAASLRRLLLKRLLHQPRSAAN